MTTHEWVEILNRRWCMCCNAFQSRPTQAAAWGPLYSDECEHNTPFAAQRDRLGFGFDDGESEQHLQSTTKKRLAWQRGKVGAADKRSKADGTGFRLARSTGKPDSGSAH